jgi:hypothetical protein
MDSETEVTSIYNSDSEEFNPEEDFFIPEGCD